MNKSDQINELAAALSAFQGEITNPKFTRTITIPGRGPYSYAELPGIVEHIRPRLTAHGLSFSQVMGNTNGQPSLTTIVMHKSGQWISGDMPLTVASGAKMQEVGSVLTYTKRYGLCSILGIAGEEDDDATTGDKLEGRELQPYQAKRDPLAKPRWGSGPPPHTTPKAKAEVAFAPAETYEDFHARAVASGKRIATTPNGPAFLDGIAKNYGFSMKPDAPNRYDSFELKILNQALCDMEAY